VAGIVKKNVAPSPGLDSAQIRPPWRSMIFLQIASPIARGPDIPGACAAAVNRTKNPAEVFGINADSVILHLEEPFAVIPLVRQYLSAAAHCLEI